MNKFIQFRSTTIALSLIAALSTVSLSACLPEVSKGSSEQSATTEGQSPDGSTWRDREEAAQAERESAPGSARDSLGLLPPTSQAPAGVPEFPAFRF